MYITLSPYPTSPVPTTTRTVPDAPLTYTELVSEPPSTAFSTSPTCDVVGLMSLLDHEVETSARRHRKWGLLRTQLTVVHIQNSYQNHRQLRSQQAPLAMSSG